MYGLAFIPFFMVISLFLIILPLSIGIYVYRDAERRGMNALLWTLIVIFAPSFIGLIIYVLIRENQTGYECAECHAPVKGDQDFCPSCGASLQSRYDLNADRKGESGQGRINRETGQSKMGPIILAIMLVAIGFIMIIVFFGMFALRGSNFYEQFLWR